MKARIKNADHNGANWFDTIGWNIANQDKYGSGWENVVISMTAKSIGKYLLHTKKGEPIGLAKFMFTEEKVGLDDYKCEVSLCATLTYYKPYSILECERIYSSKSRRINYNLSIFIQYGEI